VPLEAFEVLVLIALTDETTSWHPYCHAIVARLSRISWRCRRARSCLAFSTTELWLATGPREASADLCSLHETDLPK
jgi:hypothetical protein